MIFSVKELVRAIGVRFGLRGKPGPALPVTADSLIASSPEIRDLLNALGYNPRQEQAADRMMAELKSSIRAELTDYNAFQKAIAAAAIRSKSMPPDGSFALLDSLNAAGDQGAVLALLNADPIHDQVPFIEQIPVRKNGELTWRSPVDHSSIRRRPVDLSDFRRIIGEMEDLFSVSHPARLETPRLDVLDAISRLVRELDRDRSYLPTPLQFLETKIAEYKARSVKPAASELTEILLSTVAHLVEISNSIQTNNRNESAREIAAQAVRYLNTPRIQTPWLTSYILGLLLDPGLVSSGAWMFRLRYARTMERIRSEIKGGYYDSREVLRRLRRMEVLGFHVPSLVYPLLRLSIRRERTKQAGFGRQPAYFL